MNKDQWKVCDLAGVKDNTKPSKEALDCINNNIIKPAVQIAIDIANDAKNQLTSDYSYLKDVADLKIEDVLDTSSQMWVYHLLREVLKRFISIILLIQTRVKSWMTCIKI